MFNRNKSLKWRAEKLLEERNIQLYNIGRFSFTKRLNNIILSSRGWWFILIVVIICFVISSFNKLNVFNISVESAKILVDQRVANIAFITSITLVVVGFLINNLAIKEPFAYKILFKKSYLYPIIYFILTTLGCFFIISTLRDSLIDTLFIDFVILGTYLSLLVLLFIGILFNVIIKFTNDKVIFQYFHKELLLESKILLRKIKIRKYSGIIFKEFMNDLNGQQKGMFMLFNSYIFRKKSGNIIEDVNLNRISKYINNHSKEFGDVFYYRLLMIGDGINEYNYIWKKDKNLKEDDKKYLKDSITIKKYEKSSMQCEFGSARKYFDKKLFESIDSNDYRLLSNLLDSYFELYKLQIDNKE